MTKKPDPPSKEWREFEKQVADLEQTMGHYGITVESPGFLPDKDTGVSREIDVLVTVPYKPKDIHVMIECRRHAEAQDVMWIEQLAAKRDSVNADRAVAVSLTGFSGPAEEKARIKGIETRTLAELSVDTLLETVYIASFTSEKLLHENMKINLECGPILEHPGVPRPDPPPALERMIESEDNEAKVFFDVESQQKLSISDIWKRTAWDTVTTKLQPDAPPKSLTLVVKVPGAPPVIQAPGASQPFYLWRYTVTADFWVESIKLIPTHFYEYTNEEGLLMRRLEYDLSPGGTKCKVLLDLHPPGPDGAIPVVPTVKYEGPDPAPLFRLRNFWTPQLEENSEQEEEKPKQDQAP